MSWYDKLFGHPEDHLTFEQDLELLVARWTDRSRKRENALPLSAIAEGLLIKAKQLIKEKPK